MQAVVYCQLDARQADSGKQRVTLVMRCSYIDEMRYGPCCHINMQQCGMSECDAGLDWDIACSESGTGGNDWSPVIINLQACRYAGVD